MTAVAPQTVTLQRISVDYRTVVAVNNVTLSLPAGEILALLGPSGCGKTTLLRSIAGFVPHSGEIFIGEQHTTKVPPHRRNIGMVFQDYALFPHMSVAQNVGFGLRMRGVERGVRDVEVRDILKLVGLEGFEARMPGQLSGGQQQRVALARALAMRPRVLLLDEPLSALDKKLREEMRGELKRIQRITGLTTIFVTHDQEEAMGLADRLALMHRGSLLQYGAPEEIYRRPRTRFVAEFLGASNSKTAICRSTTGDLVVLEMPGIGVLKGLRGGAKLAAGEHATVFVRPERIRVSAPSLPEQHGNLTARVLQRTYLGRHVELALQLGDGSTWTAHVGADAAHLHNVGESAALEIDPADVLVFSEGAAE